MNKSYRLIWNELTQAWVAVAETAKARGKRTSGAIIAAAVLSAISSAPTFAQAVAPNQLPTGGQIVGGAAAGNIATSGANMTVTQQQQRMIANWDSFNIGANASVNFVQPSASAIALNRVLSQDPTQILGRLSANGLVMLINPAGVVFGQGSQVNVGGLIASTLAISDANFMAGNHAFAKEGIAGSVVNQGRIVTPDGGIVAFLAPVVKNEGQIETPKGSILLAAAEKVTVDFTGDGLITYQLDAGAVGALAENSGSIAADGGLAVLTAKAADAVTRAVVNNSGVVQARSLGESNGRILLMSDASFGDVRVTGTLDASGRQTGQTGGNVSVLGERVGLLDGANIDVAGDTGGGTALVGGNWQGKGPEANAQLTVVAETASIDVSALGNGDGGTAVVWADGQTAYRGNIRAKGGATGGNGGQIEVSGKSHLDFAGQVDAFAPAGENGSLLLDPKNIIIATADPGGGAVSQSTPTNLDQFVDLPTEISWITDAALQTLLHTAAVSLVANNDITVTNFLAPTTGSSNLTLSAGRSIFINDNISLRGTFIATANSNNGTITERDPGQGGFTMGSGKSIVTTGSSGITVQNGLAPNTAGEANIQTLNASGGISVIADSIQLGGGTGSFQATSTINIRPYSTDRSMEIGGTNTDAGTGKLVINATELDAIVAGGSLNFGNVDSTATMTILGNAALKGTQVSFESGNSSGTGSIVLANDARITMATGSTNGLSFRTGKNSGSFTQQNGATIDAGLNNLSIYTNAIDLAGAADSIIVATNKFITIAPSTARQIVINDAGNVGDLALATSELAVFKAGFNTITFGNKQLDGGINIIGNLSFGTDSVSFYNKGTILLDGGAHLSAGTVYIDASTGSFNQGAGDTRILASGTIGLYADSMALNGDANTISSSGGGIYIYPNTATRKIVLAGNDNGALSLTTDEIATLADGFSVIQIGRNNLNTGGITIEDAFTNVKFKDNLTLLQAGSGEVLINGGLEVDGALVIGAHPTTTSVATINNSITATGITIGTPVTINPSGAAVTISARSGTATFSKTVDTGTKALNVEADDIVLGGNWMGTGERFLSTRTTGRTIGIGEGAGQFQLSTAEMSYLNNGTPSRVYISGQYSSTLPGLIDAKNFSFSNPLRLESGAISLNGLTLTNTLYAGALRDGNLTVAGNVTTTSTAADAIVLLAGEQYSAGDSRGGNVIVTGTPTISTGAGGRINIYTGTQAGSTGLAAWATTNNGTSYYSKSSSFTPTGTGVHVAYREAQGGGSGTGGSGGTTGSGDTSVYVPPPPVPPSTSGNPNTTSSPQGGPTDPSGAPSSPFTPPSIFTPSPVGGTGGPVPGGAGNPGGGTLNLGGAQGSVLLNFTSTGNSVVLQTGKQGGDASGLSGAADGARNVSMLLFTQNGNEAPTPNGALTVTEQGQTLKATPSAGEVSSIPTIDPATMRFASVDYTLPTGGSSQITVGFSPDGVLLIKVPPSVKASLDDRHITLIGLLIGKQQLNVDTAAVKGIVIQVGESL